MIANEIVNNAASAAASTAAPAQQVAGGIPVWVWIVIVLLLVAVGVLAYILLQAKSQTQYKEMYDKLNADYEKLNKEFTDSKVKAKTDYKKMESSLKNLIEIRKGVYAAASKNYPECLFDIIDTLLSCKVWPASKSDSEAADKEQRMTEKLEYVKVEVGGVAKDKNIIDALKNRVIKPWIDEIAGYQFFNDAAQTTAILHFIDMTFKLIDGVMAITHADGSDYSRQIDSLLDFSTASRAMLEAQARKISPVETETDRWIIRTNQMLQTIAQMCALDSALRGKPATLVMNNYKFEIEPCRGQVPDDDIFIPDFNPNTANTSNPD